jgi:1,4-dihydroxy-2-naphthoate polyprenyltransferase
MWKVWVLASRPHTLTASLSPCIVGYAIASSTIDYHSSVSLFLIFLRWFFFCVLIQLATNLHNDYADFIKGADTVERVGQARATQKGWLSPSQTAGASTGCLATALAIGIPLLPSDRFFWCILGSSCFNAVAYTGGPYPLGYIGLGRVSIAYWGMGDVFCFIYFGFVAVLTIPYIVLRLNGNTEDLITLIPQLKPLCAVPAALLSTAIIVVNNLRDRHTDLKANKRTLAVRFGAMFCKVEYTFLLLAAYGVAMHQSLLSSSLASLPLLTIPLAANCVKAMWIKEGRDLNPFVGKTAFVELLYCVLQSTAMLLAKR